MRTRLVSAACIATFAMPALSHAQAAASPHSFSGNVSLVSDYRFRGIAQTFKRPALQGGVDYSHASGLYLGNWNSNVNEGAGFPSANLEMDFYGGWKKTWGDFGLDLGAIYYDYPGSNATATDGTGPLVNPRNAAQTHTGRIDNTELYIGGSWKFVSLKYYHATSDYFALPGTKGSNYLDFGASFDLGNGWGITGHVGRFRLKSWHTGTDATNGNYTDWKIGVTRDLNGWVLGAAYVDTDAKGSCTAGNAGFYCFSNQNPASTTTRNAGSGTIVLSVAKSF